MAQRNPRGAQTALGYDRYGLLASLRDALGRIVEETDYWGQSRHYQYDACGRLTATIDPLGQRIGFATDPLGRIVKKTLPDVRAPGQQVQEQFAYDARGQLVELRNRHRTATRRFDALGQLLEEVQDGFRVGYGYDAVGNRVLRETSAGNRIAFGYDLRDQVVEVAINDDAPIAIERDALGRTTREQLSAHVQRQFQYDGRSLLTAQSVLKDAVPLFETTYDYDRAGNLTHRRDSVQGVDEYRYDVLGRLLQHTDPKGRIERFFNDPAGDRLATRVQQVQLRKVAGGDDDQQVQWTREGSYAGVHYVFDRAGDLIRKGSPTGPQPDDLELLWDANHRLAESRKAGQATHYGYDPLGRRVFKRNQTHTTWFYWDGDALLGEVKQAHDEPDAARVWVGNVADLIEAKRRKEKLAKLHERTREYVYYPDTFMPLALIEKELRSVRGGMGAVSAAIPENTALAVPAKPNAAVPVDHSLPLPPTTTSSQKQPVMMPSRPLGVLGGSVLLRESTTAKVGGNREAKEQGSIGALGTFRGLPPGNSDQSVTITKASASPFAIDSISPLSFSESIITSQDAVAGAEWCSISYQYCVDPNGCPVKLIDTGGTTVWGAAYNAWGGVRELLVGLIENNVRFQGQYFDFESGLAYNRYRYYAQDLGSYISQDPMGQLGGVNIYGYGWNPIANADPLGLMPWPNPTNVGHHLVPQSLARSVGGDVGTYLGTNRNTPTFFFNEPYQSGAHEAIHRAQRPHVGRLQGSWSGTGDELIDASGRGLANVGHIRGDLRIPATGEILARDVTPSQAFEKLKEWFNKARSGC